MKIVHIITRLVNGGADENTVLCCNAAADAGHDVLLLHGGVAAPAIAAKVGGRVRVLQVPGLVRELNPWKEVQAFFNLYRILKRESPDVVHTHTSKAGILGRAAAGWADAGTIIHGIHIVPFDNVGALQRIVYLAAEKWAGRRTDAFISVSQGMRDLFLQAGIGSQERHHVIHSGFDVEAFRRAAPAEDLLAALQGQRPEPTGPVIVMLAALEPRKRHLEFLERYPGLVRRLPGVQLVLAGEGPLRAAIEERIDALQLRQNVVLTGFRPDPERVIACADVCLLTSMREGLPRVIMQYLAGGKPTVACELPGLEEVLVHGRNGLVCPADDMQATVDALHRLLADSQELSALAGNARRTDLARWDAAKLAAGTLNVYEEQFRARPSPRRGSRQDAVQGGSR